MQNTFDSRLSYAEIKPAHYTEILLKIADYLWFAKKFTYQTACFTLQALEYAKIFAKYPTGTVMKNFLFFTACFCIAPLLANIHLTSLSLEKVGQVKQFTLNDQGEPIVVNQNGELWQLTTAPRKLADNFSPTIALAAGYSRVAGADKQGNFQLWTENQTYRSNIPLASNATMQPLAFATIAVSKQQGEYKLVRIETTGDQAKISAISSDAVLPDARPLQIAFSHSDHRQGHIAVLANPDSQTYRHAVLGDEIEAREIQYLERHTLQPLAEKLTLSRLVFEANQLKIWYNGQPKLVSVVSGGGAGGRVVLVGLAEGKLRIEAESEPLAMHRWQSPFSFNQQLYSVQMPHIIGRLVAYEQQQQHLHETTIASGLSNHAYGQYETDLTAVTAHFALIPQQGYRQMSWLDTEGKLHDLNLKLPSPVRQSQTTQDKAYLLLENGELWQAEKIQ